MTQPKITRNDAHPMRACYRDLHRYKYQLLKPYVQRTGICGHTFKSSFLRIESDGTLEVFGRYAWDGPSGPAPDVPCLMRASLVHDALYQLIRLEALPFSTRDAADRILQRIAKEDGLPGSLAFVVYWAVRLFGASCARPGTDEEIAEICVP